MNITDARSVNWLDIMAALGLTPDRRIMPAAVVCPLCQTGSLHVYYDPSYGSWLWCASCLFNGDPLSLAAAVWKSDAATTIARLVNEQRMDVASDFVDTYADFKRRVMPFDAFWNQATADFDMAVRHLPDSRPNVLSDFWRQNLRHTRRSTYSSGYWQVTQHQQCIPRLWLDFTVTPLETLPGRRAGMLAMRHGVTQVVADTTDNDTLILGLQQVCQSPADFLVVTDSLDQAFRLQLSALRENAQVVPPICGMLNRGTYAHAWRQIRQSVTFWGASPTPAIFREAASCGGSCVFQTKLAAGPASVFAKLKALAAQAQPWASAMASHLARIPKADVRTFVLTTHLARSELAVLHAHVDEELKPSLSLLADTAGDVVHYAGYEISRHGTTLLAYKLGNDAHKPLAEKQTQIADTVLLIQQVTKTDEFWYKGEIKFKNQTIRFECAARDIESNPELWLRNMCRGRGFVPFVHKSWRRYIVPLGELFGFAHVIPSTVKVGWLFEEGGLATSQWLLSRGGMVSEWGKPLKSPPGRINVPIPMTATAVGALSQLPGACGFWGVLAHVTANLLSPITGRIPRNLVLMGQAACTIGPIASRLSGCATIGNASLAESPELLQQLRASVAGNWPIMLLADRSDNTTPNLLAGDNRVATIYRPKTELRGISLMISHDCDMIDVNVPAGGLDMLERYGGDVLPAYLLHLARRDFKVFLSENPTASILTDMGRWWVSAGGKANMQQRFFYGDARAKQALHRLLMLCRKRIVSMPLGFSDLADPAKIPIETDETRLFLDPLRLQSVMAWRAQLDVLRFGGYLREAGLLTSGPEEKFWALPLDAWTAVLAASTRLQRIRPAAEANEDRPNAEKYRA
jgi:hypothetical protein